ncbi:MAG TPA: class I SAM-dependent methyltransferase [Steroidobacteraceae bacterium]|nr:class I SAM-dependent methyltransferase [Steroidobacteraceae bacterium]
MSNSEQIAYWNGEAGNNWVAQADALDRMMHGIGEQVLTSAKLKGGDRVLDIGCGSGQLTLAAQKQAGDSGQVIGLDVSQQLIRDAQSRAARQHSRATFIEADAAMWLADVPADTVISRFGVMFFENPIVAFANILQSTQPGGHLTFSCWRHSSQNDMSGGMMQSVAHLFTPPAVKPDPKAPGAYAFSDESYVNTILTNAGWHDVKCEQWDGALPLPAPNASDNATFLAHLGPIGRLMREQNVAAERVIDGLVPFLESRKTHDTYILNASAWIVSAHH